MQRSLGDLALLWLGRRRRNSKYQTVISIGLVVMAPVLVILTYVVLGPLDRGPTNLLRYVVLADFVYVMVIAALIIQNVARLVVARRARSAGSRLHLRLTGVFALLALLPSVLVAVFAVATINFGLEGWFSSNVRNVVGASLRAAQAYSDEHRDNLRRDVNLVADYLNNQKRVNRLMDDGELRQVLGAVQSQVEYFISETFVLDGQGDIRIRGGGSYRFDFERPSPDQMAQARDGELVVIEDQTNNEFRALLRLTGFVDHYLLVTRDVDGEIISLTDETRETVKFYQTLEADRGQLLFRFGLLYLGFALILVLAAIWMGLQFAERLSRPVGRLLTASQKVGAGNLDVRVREEEGDDEIASLGRNFNQMTSRLKLQRAELLARTDQIEERRRLFDSVLSSVTSGVVGVDPDGRIAFVNRSARRLLDVSGDQSDQALTTAVPEFAPMFDDLRLGAKRQVQQQVTLLRNGVTESLLVRMSPRWGADDMLEGYVVAFDDVTDLVTAQRMAAWGDVARRIAHEIKNPLTPIQLSAERIRRKFGKYVPDPTDLDRMTGVITRQTNDLRRIVDEFSKFARMPEPDKSQQDLGQILRDVVLLQETGQPNVTFHVDIPDRPMIGALDATMMSQAFTNLLKNAGEAIEELDESQKLDGFTPQIHVTVIAETDTVTIRISDNGIGLPSDRSKLFEPYVTTREKGTGLGLPIVKKIIEEHGGTLSLTDAAPFGPGAHYGAQAVVTLMLLSKDALQGDPDE